MPGSNPDFQFLIGRLFSPTPTPRYSSSSSSKRKRKEQLRHIDEEQLTLEQELRRSPGQTTANKAQKKVSDDRTDWTKLIKTWIRPGQKFLGEGNSAKTIELDPNDPTKPVAKLIPLTLIATNKNIPIDHLQNLIKKEFELHKEVQDKVQLDDGQPCVPQLQSEFHIEEIYGQRYAVYLLDRLVELEIREEKTYERALKISRKFVEKGYLHNDLHQANVMMTKGGDLRVIDLGNMRRMPDNDKLSNDLLECIYFGQTAALYDNCNDNTNIKHFKQMVFVDKQLTKSRQIVEKLFGKTKPYQSNPNPNQGAEDLTSHELRKRLLALGKPTNGRREELVERIREHEEVKEKIFLLTTAIEDKLLTMQLKDSSQRHKRTDPNFQELVMQLLLASLSTHYFPCDKMEQKFDNVPVCKDLSNYIYAIRDPSNQENMTTVGDVYRAIKDRQDFHN